MMFDNIAQLFHPHDPQCLAQAMARHERLYLPAGNPAAFADLLSWDCIDRLVTAQDLQDERLRFVRENRVLPLEMVTAHIRGWKHRRRSAQSIHQLAAQGVSLGIIDIHKSHPPVGQLCQMLERWAGVVVGARAYLSFTQDSAFKSHWDEHDVLVLQIAGRKKWRLYGHPTPYPEMHPQIPGPTLEMGGAPELELVMSPGDILFVPRGDVHKGMVDGPHSVHLTFGLWPRRGHHVLDWLVQQSLPQEQMLRQDIHPDLSEDDLDRQQSDLRDALHRMVDGLDLRRFLSDDHGSRPVHPALNLGGVGQLLTGQTVLGAVLLRRFPLPAQGGRVSLGGRSYDLTADQCRVLEMVTRLETCRLADLAQALPHIDIPAAATYLAGLGLIKARCPATPVP